MLELLDDISWDSFPDGTSQWELRAVRPTDKFFTGSVHGASDHRLNGQRGLALNFCVHRNKASGSKSEGKFGMDSLALRVGKESLANTLAFELLKCERVAKANSQSLASITVDTESSPWRPEGTLQTRIEYDWGNHAARAL